MTTGQLIILDHVVALLNAAAWLAAGATTAVGLARLALGLLGAAMGVTLIRVCTVVLLTGRGWWFAQEKVLLDLPMLAVAGLAAVLLAGRPLLAAARATTVEAIPPRGVVALLAAGYAALAGFVVTFLFGNPLRWSTALLAVATVGTAVLLTARVVTPATTPTPAAGRGLSRRRFLTVAGGAVVAGTGTTGVGLAFGPTETVDNGGGLPARAPTSRSVVDLRGPTTPAPGGAVRRFVLTAQTTAVRLPSGRELQAWTFNGLVPGPPITATVGDLVEVTLRNRDVHDGVTVHWHGYDVACGDDGVPGVTQTAVAPGGEFVYRFRADQAGTFWYHTHHASHIGVRRGLYGALVVTPRSSVEGLDLILPLHTFDGAVVLADHDGRTDRTVPPGTAVRLRLINTDSGPHRYVLSGTPYIVSAVDGRDLNQPDEVRDHALRLPAGGRYDLVFTMPDGPVALIIDSDRTGGLQLLPQGGPAVAADSGADGWPELDLLTYGAPATLPFDASTRADRHFTMVLDRGVAMVDGQLTYAQTVNGRGHPGIPDQVITEGDLVRFTVVNRSLETHPWHLHGHAVLVLAVNGASPQGSPLWMDTFDLRPGDVWQVAFKAANPGIWMNHCHNLPHADQGMMLRLRYDGVTTPFSSSHSVHEHS